MRALIRMHATLRAGMPPMAYGAWVLAMAFCAAWVVSRIVQGDRWQPLNERDVVPDAPVAPDDWRCGLAEEDYRPDGCKAVWWFRHGAAGEPDFSVLCPSGDLEMCGIWEKK